jgi:hypothetical protein
VAQELLLGLGLPELLRVAEEVALPDGVAPALAEMALAEAQLLMQAVLVAELLREAEPLTVGLREALALAVATTVLAAAVRDSVALTQELPEEMLLPEKEADWPLLLLGQPEGLALTEAQLLPVLLML